MTKFRNFVLSTGKSLNGDEEGPAYTTTQSRFDFGSSMHEKSARMAPMPRQGLTNYSKKVSIEGSSRSEIIDFNKSLTSPLYVK